MYLGKFSDFYSRFEKYISPIGLIYGFIFTSLTLTRVDMFLENFWIVVHFMIAGFGILAYTLYENRVERKNTPEPDRQKFYLYLTLIIQFAFGGLFSTFFVFYMRSSSFAQSWLFLLFLLILLVGNELWKKHYQRLVFQIVIFFISLYLFLTFLLPVIFHRLGSDLFIYAGLFSSVIIFLFLLLLKKFAHERFKSKHNAIRISVIGIFVFMNILYFANIIPPIPLALKESGVYHQIKKINSENPNVEYEVKSEVVPWYENLFVNYPVYHKKSNEGVYVYSAIFSPVAFDTEIVHQWQYYDESKKLWVNSTKINLPISGGRDQGFRTYSFKQAVNPGLWRVKVMTVSGRVMGTVNFKVEIGTTAIKLIDKTI